MSDDDPIGPRGLERGLDLLELISRSPEGLLWTDLLKRLEITKPALTRLCKSLQKRDLIVRDPSTRRFHRGPGLSRLAAGMEWAPGSRKAIAHHAMPVLQRLRKAWDQSFCAVHWNGKLMECVANTVPEHGLAIWSVGEKHDRLDRGPMGLCCARFGHAEERLQTPLTDESVRMEQARELPLLGERGWSVFLGRRCHRLAAPLFVADDRLVGAIGCFAHPLAIDGYTVEQLGAAIAEGGREISRLLGWRTARAEGATA